MHRLVSASRYLLLRTALTAGLLAAQSSAWSVVKCVAPDGHVTFQDVGCHAQSSAQPLVQRYGQLTSEPPAPRAQRSPSEARTTARKASPSAATPGTASGGFGPVTVPAWR